MSNLRTPQRTIVTDFRAGELDPRVLMRSDSKIYSSGARSLKNCILSNTGAASRRPGTTRLAALSGRARLLEFEYDSDEKYIFAFRNAALDIYDETGTLVQSFSGSTDCPWTSTTMWQITYAQLADVTVICHETFHPKKYTRTSLTTFSAADFAFDTSTDLKTTFQPYSRFEASNVKLKVSNTAIGTGRTITADTAIFSASWVGDIIRIAGCEIELTAYTSSTVMTGTVINTVQTYLDSNPLNFVDASGTITIEHLNHGYAAGISITIADAPTTYDIAAGNINGARTIVSVLDDDTYTITAGASDTANTTGAGGATGIRVSTTDFTNNWDEQTFSIRRGHPSAVAFHEDRLWFGGTTEIPNGMWGSVVGSYFDFDVGSGQDDESVQFQIASQRFSKIRHLVSARGLLVFSEGVEFAVETGAGEPITPGGAEVRAQTTFGANYIRPRVFDGAVLFIGANNKTVREFIYDFSTDAFTSPDVMTAASHLLAAPIDFTVVYGTATRDEQYAMFIDSDGDMAIFHSIRQEQLAAWTPWETHGSDKFDSVCTLGSKVFVSALRGGTYFLERVEFDDPDITLDSSKSMTASSTVTWALGSTYASKTVSVLSGGRYIGDFTANGSGTITLDDPVTEIIAGFDFDVEIIPMPPIQQHFDGPTVGERRRINAVNVHYFETVACTINGGVVLSQNELTEDMEDPPVPFTGKRRTFLRGYDMDPAVTITQDEPLAMTILGLVMEVSQ
jgi:hypothetical protein